MSYARRQARVLVLEAIERRVKQFASSEHIWPFRIPHDPLSLDDIIRDALREQDGFLDVEAIKSRNVLRMEWRDSGYAWEAWAITVDSGIHVYCDSDEHETRVLASLKRGNPREADGFFLDLLAESRGAAFGIEMAARAPGAVRTPIDDREFLTDVFVELFEGIVDVGHHGAGAPEVADDFRQDVASWLEHVLVAPPPGRRRMRRLQDARDTR